jgi:hypothetical protein
VTGVTALRLEEEEHSSRLPHRECAMKRAIIIAVLGFALAVGVFVEVSTYREIVSFADASIDAGPAF